MAPVWYPDWRGKRCAIIASGPSAKSSGVELLRGGRLPVIAIKENIELCPDADVVYGCDAAWWKNNNGLPGYRGLRVAFSAVLRTSYPDIHLVDLYGKEDRLLMDRMGTIGSGGNSGFQAMNLAAQFGAKGILLVGFDMHEKGGVHWYGRSNGPGRTNPDESNFKRWRSAFAGAAPKLEELGVEVINASMSSTLKCFRKLSVQETLIEWGL